MSSRLDSWKPFGRNKYICLSSEEDKIYEASLRTTIHALNRQLLEKGAKLTAFENGKPQKGKPILRTDQIYY